MGFTVASGLCHIQGPIVQPYPNYCLVPIKCTILKYSIFNFIVTAFDAFLVRFVLCEVKRV